MPPLSPRNRSHSLACLFAVFVAFASFWSVPARADAPPPQSGRVALMVDSPAEGLGGAWPIFCGVPFPKGSLTDVRNARVVDGAGRPVAAQLRVMATWPGTEFVRWLGVDFAGDPSGEYYLEFGPDVSLPPAVLGAPRIAVERDGDAFVITTGPARFVVPSSGPLVSLAHLDRNGDGRFGEDELVIRADEGDLYVIDNHGRKGVVGLDPAPDDVRLEPGLDELAEQGAPLRVTVRREGWYADADGNRLGRHITRLHFFADQPFAHVEHTFVITEDTKETWFRDIGVRFAHALPDARTATFPASDPVNGEQNPEVVARADTPYAGDAVQIQLDEGERAFMFQEKAFYFSRMDPEKDCRFVIGRENADGTETVREGSFAGDWADVRGPRGGLTVSIRRLWQQYPKEIEVSSDAVTARFWSNRGGREWDFRLDTLREQWPKDWLDRDLHGDYGSAWTRLMERDIYDVSADGLARTHDLLLFLHDGAASHADIAKRAHVFSRPVLAIVDPQWLYASEAMGPIHPRDTERFPMEESFMESYFDQHMAIVREWGDYGMLDYGSGPHIFYRVGRGEGHPFEGRWYPYLNRYSGHVDYGFHTHLWRMYARSGQRKYLDYAEETNRHRMDICMIHWGPDADYSTNHGFMIGKYKGAFSASNTPVYWWNRPILHHQSGTDIRKLYWYYYLRDYRRAYDVAESYRELVKKLWEHNPQGGPFRGTRPFATLKNLGTVYQETGDPKVLEIGRDQLEWLVALESPQGVIWHLPGGMGKYGTKISGIERWYEATGDELAAKALLRGAHTYARTSLGNPPFSYYNVFARALNRAYRITGDLLYAGVIKRNMDLAVAANYDFEKGEWKDFFGTMASASISAYPLGDMAKGMDAIVRAGDAIAPPLTVARGRPVVAVFRKGDGKEAVLDVRGRFPLRPRVFTLDGQPVEAVIEPFREALYSLEPVEEPRFYTVRLPEGLPGGDYVLDAGIGGAGWEVFAADAERVAMFAPGGIVSAPTREPWRFLVPRGTRQFEVFGGASVDLRRPDGERVDLEADESGWASAAVPPGQAGSLWAYSCPPNTFVELRGMPPALTTGSAERFFVPDFARIPVERFGMERDYRFAHEQSAFADPEARFAPGALLGDEPGQGLALHSRRAFRFPRGEAKGDGRFAHFNAREGTLEFWFKPDWSTVLGARNNYVLDIGPWFIRLQTEGRPQSMFRIPANRGDFRDYAEMTLERSRWTHLAWQWFRRDGNVVLETYVNGKRKSVSEYDDRVPADPGENILIGHHRNRPVNWGSLNGVVDQLRISSGRRYDGDFGPSRDAPLEADGATLVLFRFDGTLDGVSGDGGFVEGSLLE